MNNSGWRASPVLGVRHVRQAAEYYRDVLGFSLDPVDGVFQPTVDEPGGVYAIVKRSGVWIHFQIRRGDLPPGARPAFERDAFFTWTISTACTPVCSNVGPKSFKGRA